MSHRSVRIIGAIAAAAASLAATPLGCAQSERAERVDSIDPTSAEARALEDPFPRLAEAIEPGLTLRREIRIAFGDPDRFEKHWNGSATWRYHHAALLVEANITPEVAARETTRTRAVLASTQKGGRSLLDWWSYLFEFPPKRQTPAIRNVPANVHHLTVHFKPDGVVAGFEYRQQIETVTVPK